MQNQPFVFNGKLNLTVVGWMAFLCLAAALNVSAAIFGKLDNNAAPDAVSALAQQTKLVAADGAANEFFGLVVRISGNTAIVGSQKKVGANAGQGAVYILCQNRLRRGLCSRR